VTLRNANWKADYLVNPVLITQATLHLDHDGMRWDSVAFSYGPVRGTASLSLPADCGAAPCVPHFEAEFGALDASLLQAAFLGARERGTLISTLLERLRPTMAPAWPRIEGTVKADALILGPVTLRQATASVSIAGNGAEVTSLEASLPCGSAAQSRALAPPKRSLLTRSMRNLPSSARSPSGSCWGCARRAVPLTATASSR
jgi:hypothetical protein